MKNWLENHWAIPAYGGGLLIAIALCFFGAALNTMAGWLYAICGTILALLIFSIFLPIRSLRSLEVRRLPIAPVSAGDDMTVTLEIDNPDKQAKTFLEIADNIPFVLGTPKTHPVDIVPPRGSYRWTYYLPTTKRGVYRWQDVNLRTGAPLGLFWCRRQREASAKAIVYPRVLPLKTCPLIDSIGQEENRPRQSERHYQQSTEGFTRNLRQYRYGDPTRLIHWKTSARLGEFQIRELEVLVGGQDVIICLDTVSEWKGDTFDRAVTAAASLYFYAHRHGMNVKLWTAKTGLIHGERVILECLAATEPGEAPASLPDLPLIWLTSEIGTLENLPAGSRWLFFPVDLDDHSPALLFRQFSGITIDPERPLEEQLQKPPR